MPLYGLWRGSWLDALLSGIALGMSMLPEEFPLVLTVFMVMGAWRISQPRVLTRRIAAIETLGAATVLCTDKTGTLTQNRMTIAELWVAGEAWRSEQRTAPDAFVASLECGILASAPNRSTRWTRRFGARRRGFRSRAGAAPRSAQMGIRPTPRSACRHSGLGRKRGELIVAAKGAPRRQSPSCAASARPSAPECKRRRRMAAAACGCSASPGVAARQH